MPVMPIVKYQPELDRHNTREQAQHRKCDLPNAIGYFFLLMAMMEPMARIAE